MDIEKEKKAIEYLKLFEPPKEKDELGYYLCYSGGKDSDVIRILAKLADVRHTVEHNLTTVDAPETIYYIRSIGGVIINSPEMSMWKLIEHHQYPPTRLTRYCCRKLKEAGGDGRLKVTGVRKNESVRRKKKSGLVQVIGKPKKTEKLAVQMDLEYDKPTKESLVMNLDNDDSRRFVEQCYRTRKTLINPIVDWTEDDVWEFLHHYGCKSNPLYEDGYDRIGCIGCPMAALRKREREFERWPKYKENYIKAFDRMIKAREASGKETTWKSGEEVFEVWMSY